MKNFNDYFEPFVSRFQIVTLTTEEKRRINKFVTEVIRAKQTENVHQIDNFQEHKRWTTGVSGEIAVERLMGKEFFDWSIGDSRFYDVPDLRSLGLNIGIKSVEYGKFPTTHKLVKRPEIITVKKGDDIYICGLATINALNIYQDDDLILSWKLRQRNVKTGFYGFEFLKPFSSFNELKQRMAEERK